MTQTTVKPGTKVRFSASLSNGGTALWTSVVVRVDRSGIASVRHPKQARAIPFSPVPTKALYLYRASDLARSVVVRHEGVN